MRPRFILVLAAFFFTHTRADDWPQWLGPTRNGIPAADAPVLQSFPAMPKRLWRIPVGGGFSSPVVAKDALVYLDEKGGNEIAHCIDAASGTERWAYDLAPTYQDEWGAGPRSTPTIDEDRVYAQSCNGEFRCLKLKDGSPVWAVSFEKDFGVKFLGSKANEGTATRRGHNGSALIAGEHAFVPVGSIQGAMMVCFNKRNGSVVWKSGTDESAYSSPVLGHLAGQEQLVYFSADALLGMDPANGKELWRTPLKTNAKRHAMTPLFFEDSVIVNSHSIGLIRFVIEKTDGKFTAKQLWANRQLLINLTTPVIVGDYLYSQGPAKDFICADLKTGKQIWSQPGFGKEVTSTIPLGNHLLSITDDGQLVWMEANPSKYTEITRMQICGKNWNFPAYAGGKLYVRDNRELSAYDLLAK